ncbi:MAG: regulatory iron-sulfur-containing complex subunit RicT [Bacteroidia bacterium]|nr:regulatory iron-sulfur-containing complex subunit RicT [Bacteroidia bacterium]
MLGPDQSEVDNIYEVRFKGTRKAFYRNVNGLRLYIGDHVVVESDRGYDLGTLSLGGVMAELQMKKKGFKKDSRELPRIYRKANEADIQLYQEARAREQETLVRTREIISEQKLDMKLSDVEFQADNTKAVFYYIADHRVDFRELIKVLAREFKIRVEMKQIGLRFEAGLLGGIGSCGRELCCSTWLTEFRSVNTSAARYQNLSLNPMKISGLCGRLKCCLNYELEAYLDAMGDFPDIHHIETSKGRALLQKTDIFKRLMWFSYPNDNAWYPLDVDLVNQIVEQNKQGERPDIQVKGTVMAGVDGAGPDEGADLDFVDVVGTGFPEEKDSRPRKKKKRPARKKGGEPQAGAGRNPQGQPQAGSGQQRPAQQPRNQQRPAGEPRNQQRPAGEPRNQQPRNPDAQPPRSQQRPAGEPRPQQPRSPEGRNRPPQGPRPDGQQPQGNRNRSGNKKRRGGNRPGNPGQPQNRKPDSPPEG